MIWTQELEHAGFAVVPEVLSEPEIAALLNSLKIVSNHEAKSRVYAIRNLLDVPAVREVAKSAAIRALVEPILGANCFAVRGIFFDKVPGANWKVPYHQDLSIAVKSRREVAGFGPWSLKEGVIHVQPPDAILQNMLTVRLHLDACDSTNGALRVVPGSHQGGRVESGVLQVEAAQEQLVEVARGGAMLMRPLLWHASSPAKSPSHRRVVHLEFAARELPNSLEWNERV